MILYFPPAICKEPTPPPYERDSGLCVIGICLAFLVELRRTSGRREGVEWMAA